MECLALISFFMDYPDRSLWSDKNELLTSIASLSTLSDSQKNRLYDFYQALTEKSLLDRQADYTDLFDRGKSLSLLIFEHVHGESRERGQAMVNLIEQYKRSGLAIKEKELPDYLPVYLEYLSAQDKQCAKNGLKDISSILIILGARLHARESVYVILFEILLEISDTGKTITDFSRQIKDEKKDNTPEALDAVWEEEQVKFTHSGSCTTAQEIAHRKRFINTVHSQYIHLNS
ncbi:Nitrate reductase molybdenum cofactor assembly chaperone NarJ [invertebrate metagenome]|uniref:Nitrate reductase molybdenum cofactor assembly chaperone NarJ n=1 Tax=invertebrate metagenome TaxID=1711999 RepID=A0A2H9T7Z0_9ZZZZ